MLATMPVRKKNGNIGYEIVSAQRFKIGCRLITISMPCRRILM